MAGESEPNHAYIHFGTGERAAANRLRRSGCRSRNLSSSSSANSRDEPVGP